MEFRRDTLDFILRHALLKEDQRGVNAIFEHPLELFEDLGVAYRHPDVFVRFAHHEVVGNVVPSPVNVHDHFPVVDY